MTNDGRQRPEGKRSLDDLIRPPSSVIVIYYLIACGLIGDPVPPVMIKGGPQKKNS